MHVCDGIGNVPIKSVGLETVELPLLQPYKLSFTSLHSFSALIARIELEDQQESFGEVVPLPGYSTESYDSVLQKARVWSKTLVGRTVHDARRVLALEISEHSFAVSLFTSALDSITWEQANRKFSSVPIVYAVSSSNRKVGEVVSQAFKDGYNVIKVKVGRSIEQDLKCVEVLGDINEDGIKFRFDANQGYDSDQATRFLHAVSNRLPAQTELVEQPLPAVRWSAMEELCRATSLRLMLDESIKTNADIERAASIGCGWIKLKLCKQGGVYEVIRQARTASGLGLSVVLGNGVATDIVNLLELAIQHQFPELFSSSSEANGFMKLEENIIYKQLRCMNGRVRWE